MSKRKISPTKIIKAKREKKASTRSRVLTHSTSVRAKPETTAAAEQVRDAASNTVTKKQICIDLLSRAEGASIRDLEEATGWQSHSVRGFLSGEVRKRMNRQLVSETGDEGERRYRIVEAEVAS